MDVRSNDFWWHLASGKQIVETGSVPRVETFSSTRNGVPWTDFEWLFQLILFAGYSVLGIRGLILLKALLLALQTACLFLTLRRTSPYFLIHAAILGMWIHILPVRDYLRPELVTFMFFALLFYAHERFPRLGPRAIMASAVFFAAWANLHGGFVMGLAVLGIYALGACAEGDRERALSWAKATAASAAACLLNPYGWKIFWVPLEHARLMALHKGQPWQVMEWQPMPFKGFSLFWAWLALCIFVATASQIRRKKFDLAGTLILVIFTAAAVRYTRNAHLLVLASLAVLSRHLTPFVPGGPKNLTGAPRALIYAAAALLLAAADVSAYRHRFQPRVQLNDYPVRAANFLLQNPMRGNLYNSYTWGGYLAWRLAPRTRVFMDSRYMFTDLLKENHLAMQSREKWLQFLNRHKITHSLVAYPKGFSAIPLRKLSARIRSRPPRSEWMKYYPPDAWALLFWDSTALIFARRDEENRGLIERLEYRYFRADDYLHVRRLIELGKLPREGVLADIRRNLKSNGPHPAGEFFLKFFSPPKS